MSTVELVKSSMTSSVTGLLDVVQRQLRGFPCSRRAGYGSLALRSCELTQDVPAWCQGLFLANY